MKTIWKFPLQITGEQSIEMPEGAEILCAQAQGDVLCLWTLANPDAQPLRRVIEIIGTGNPFRDGERRYISTVQMPAGLVWHVFEKP